MDKERFLEVVETGLKTDDRPQWLRDLVRRPAWLYYRAFVALAEHTNPELIVELGTHHGVGALHFNYGCPTAKIITIDIAKYPNRPIMAKKGIVSVLCDSTKYADQVEDGTVDILFIDANHTYESLIADFNAWLPKMKESGIVLFDDVGWDMVLTPKTARMIHGKVAGENTYMSHAWEEIVAQEYGETFELKKLHPSYSFGVLLL
jgi:predicted O-methyltransferase YrrM